MRLRRRPLIREVWRHHTCNTVVRHEGRPCGAQVTLKSWSNTSMRDFILCWVQILRARRWVRKRGVWSFEMETKCVPMRSELNSLTLSHPNGASIKRHGILTGRLLNATYVRLHRWHISRTAESIFAALSRDSVINYRRDKRKIQNLYRNTKHMPSWQMF
jgi:hypothetical protein